MNETIGIVTTSINSKPPALAKWAQIGQLHVAGDTNVPYELPRYVMDLDGYFYSPEHQGSWVCSDFIGWKCIQRRNIAILEALAERHEYLVIVDDDNVPVGTGNEWLGAAMQRFAAPCLAKPAGQVFNPGSLCTPSTRARGVPFPPGPLDNCTDQSRIGVPVAVLASLWTGDPDVDAVERMVNAPDVLGIRGEIGLSFESGGYAPVNSQSTTWDSKFAPLAAVIPHLGRFDDIWGSYIAERIFKHQCVGVWFGHPLVSQADRNEHDLLVDLEREVFGYRHNREFIAFLNTTRLSADDILGNYLEIAQAIARELPWFPKKSIDFMHAWVEDVRSLDVGGV